MNIKDIKGKFDLDSTFYEGNLGIICVAEGFNDNQIELEDYMIEDAITFKPNTSLSYSDFRNTKDELFAVSIIDLEGRMNGFRNLSKKKVIELFEESSGVKFDHIGYFTIFNEKDGIDFLEYKKELIR